MDDKTRKRARELVEAGIKKRGYRTPWQDHMAERDPDYLVPYEAMYEEVMTRAKHLDLKFKELIVLAALAVQREDYGLRDHIKRAYRLGATEGEIIETFQTASFHTGALTLVHGMKVLLDVNHELAKT